MARATSVWRTGRRRPANPGSGSQRRRRPGGDAADIAVAALAPDQGRPQDRPGDGAPAVRHQPPFTRCSVLASWRSAGSGDACGHAGRTDGDQAQPRRHAAPSQAASASSGPALKTVVLRVRCPGRRTVVLRAARHCASPTRPAAPRCRDRRGDDALPPQQAQQRHADQPLPPRPHRAGAGAGRAGAGRGRTGGHRYGA